MTTERDDLKSKGEKDKLDKEQAIKERDASQKSVDELKQKLTEVRHELLSVTRELRCVMVNNEHVLEEKSRADDTIKDLNETIKTLRKDIEDLAKAKAAMAAVETTAVAKWEKERDRLESEMSGMRAALENKNDCETAHLSKTISKLEAELQRQHEWEDMCKELASLLDIGKSDFDVKKAPESANKLYREVEGMVEEVARLKKEVKKAKATIDELKSAHMVASMGASMGGGMGGGMACPPPCSGQRGFEADTDSSHLNYLKCELRRSTEAMASAQEKFSRFKESVAKALKFGKRSSKVDAASILSRINNLVTRIACPLDSKFDSVLHIGGRCCSKSKTTARLTGDHARTGRTLEKIQKKLRAALETIEAQDMWVSVLQAKLEGKTEVNDWGTKSCRARDNMQNAKVVLLEDLVECEEERLSASLKAAQYYSHMGKAPRAY